MTTTTLTYDFGTYVYYFEEWLKHHFQLQDVNHQSFEFSSTYQALYETLNVTFPSQMLTKEDMLLISLCLIPHIDPVAFDRLFSELLGEGDFPQLGGIRGKQHRGILPTGETALFLLSNNDAALRQHIQKKLFSPNYWLFKKQILFLDQPLSGEPPLSGKLSMNHEYVELLTIGEITPPRFSIAFPAQKISTLMEWGDLVLNSRTLQRVQELQSWVHHGQELMEEWGMKKRLKKGYRVLFYGPPGTGKTLTAALLGKSTGKDVYRVDLSMVVSKYIGETEKNLGHLFDKAANKNWILFFDEADALFGKRTGVRDAHDKYANQEVSYLLQRVETFEGLVILASNLKNNIDDAFIRRFQSIIYFPKPSASERFQLWDKAFPQNAKDRFAQDIDLVAVARQYELTGAEITNIVQYLCLMLLTDTTLELDQKGILKAIQRELDKGST